MLGGVLYGEMRAGTRCNKTRSTTYPKMLQNRRTEGAQHRAHLVIPEAMGALQATLSVLKEPMRGCKRSFCACFLQDVSL